MKFWQHIVDVSKPFICMQNNFKNIDHKVSIGLETKTWKFLKFKNAAKRSAYNLLSTKIKQMDFVKLHQFFGYSVCAAFLLCKKFFRTRTV